MSSTLKEKIYFLYINLSIIFYDYTHKMRQNAFSIHGVKYILWILSQFESNVVLSGIKYLKWRIRLYSELAYLYEDYSSNKSAYKVIIQAINKLNELKGIEEQQGPLPDHIKITLIDNFRILKILEFKYGLLSGNIQIDLWKKKIDETFPSEKSGTSTEEKLNKFICLINTISNNSKFGSIVFHEGVKAPWKQSAVMFMYESVKPEISNIKTGIVEYIEKKKRDIEKTEKIKANNKQYHNILEEYNQKDATINKLWKKSSKCVPIEIHMELLKACYDIRLWKEFTELLESLIIRLKYRRIEIPYLSEIDVQVSSIQYSNVPNKFDKIAIDLNINDYKRKIKELREKGINVGVKSEDNKSKQIGKDKDKPKQTNDNKKKIEDTPSENPYETINELDHQFVYLMLKKSHNPNKAIIGLKIVMSNDRKIKSLLDENERAICLPIRTFEDNLYEKDQTEYANIKDKINAENNKLLPYLIYKKTNRGLTDEEEKLTSLTDLFPLISNSPFADPPFNFKKNPIELSIVNQSKNSSRVQATSYNFSHNYINICYKNDEVFYIIERECEILKNLYELESTYIEPSTNEFKSLKNVHQFILLTYSIEKLEQLSCSLNSSLQGPLGNYFLNERKNFVYENCLLIWNKYLKDVLGRIDYFYQTEQELEENFANQIKDTIVNLNNKMFIILYYLHSILTNIKNKDVIMYGFISSRFADFCERTDNVAVGVDMIEKALEFINNYREEQNTFGMTNYENKHSFTSFTCDNNKIKELFNSIESKYNDYVKNLNFKRRKNYRLAFGLNKLTNEEELEEDYEHCLYEKEYSERITKLFKKTHEKFHINSIGDKEKINLFHTENENNLNCLFVEIAIKYYRLFLEKGIN